MLVSILSPVFNESLHIEEMINSVLGQTHSELELIIVDDGSTDDTVAKVEQASQRDPRIRLVSEGKLGKTRAFNRAYAEARGEVVLLMGGDDVMPSDSVKARADAIAAAATSSEDRVAAFARLRTFSENPRFDGQIIPRRPGVGARSGGTLAMSRSLADLAFPVPEELVSEDLWIGGVAGAAAERHVELDDIVLHYRIHAGNSNPRNQEFARMTESMHSRMIAYGMLADAPDLDLLSGEQQRFRMLADVEERRYRRGPVAVMTFWSAPLTTRLRAASMSSPALFKVRTFFFKVLSGW